VLVSEDDFSAIGGIEYKPASIAGKVTSMEEISVQLQEVARMVTEASKERDRVREEKGLNAPDSNPG
jgi:hypothetical protein